METWAQFHNTLIRLRFNPTTQWVIQNLVSNYQDWHWW